MRKKLLFKRFSLSALSVIGVATTASTSVLLSGKLNRAKDDRTHNNNPTYPGAGSSGTDPNDNNGSIINQGNTKVNYVALGDSIAAGYTLFNGKDNNYVNYKATDHTTATHQIYGDSYSAWTARALQNEGMLGSYDNLAVGGYTTGNLLKSMDDLYTPNTIDREHLNGITDHGKFDKGFISQDDWNNYFRNEAKIKSTIKNANLVSITIGANDMLNLLNLLGRPLLSFMTGQVGIKDIQEIIKEITHPADGKKFDWNTAVSVDPIKLASTFKVMEDNTKKVVSTIRTLNPNAKIVMMGYEMPLMQLRNFLDLAIVNGQTLVEQIISQLNQTMKVIANQFASVDYVNTDDSNKFLYNNQLSGNVTLPKVKGSDYKSSLTLDHYNPASWYMPVSIDIHPGPYGYRAAAADLLSSLIGKSTNTDPNSPLVNKSRTRIATNAKSLKGLNGDITSYNNPFADITSTSYPISNKDSRPVAYLQPQIASASLDVSNKSQIWTGLDNSLSDVNNILLMMRSKIANAINLANNANSKTVAPDDMKNFAKKYAKTDSNGKATNVTLHDVSFDLLSDFGKLKENIADPSQTTNNSEYALYYITSGMMTLTAPTSEQRNVFSSNAIGYVWVSDLLTNLNNLGMFNLAGSIIPILGLGATQESTDNLSAGIQGINPVIAPIGMKMLILILKQDMDSNPFNGYFSNQLDKILWTTINSIQTNYIYWNSLYHNVIKKNGFLDGVAESLFPLLNAVHFGTSDDSKWISPIIYGFLSAPNTPVTNPEVV